MNILQVIRSLDPALGGTVEALQQCGAAMLDAGNNVEAASLDSPAASFLSGLPFPTHALGPGIGTYSYSSRFTPWLREHAARYDCVLVHGIWAYHSLATWQVLRSTSVPYLVFAHGMLDPWFKRRYPLKHLKKWLYWPWAEYRVLRDAKAVLFTCEEERKLAHESFWLYKCNEAVVGLGISSPNGNPAVERELFLSRFPHLRGKRVALFLSRIHPKKGCDLLIEAFARVLGGKPEWQLVLAGPDQIAWKAALDQRANTLGIADQVTWAGMLSGAAKWGAFYSSEFFILPSHSENFGVAVAEALACGLPVLISDKVNIWREVLADGAGIVGPDTLPGTADLLARWLHVSIEANAQMRARAKACFDRRFEVRSAASALRDVLERVVSGSATRTQKLVEVRP